MARVNACPSGLATPELIAECSRETVGGHDVFTSYKVLAVPITVGKTGDKGFCSDQDGVIKVDPKGGTNCTEPLQ